MKYKKFNEIEVEKMTALYKEGYNYREIGEIMNRNQGSIKTKLQTIGIAKKKVKELLWDVERVRKYISDIEEAKKLSRGSSKRIGVKCPSCEYKKTITVNRLVNKSFSCPFCDIGFSYPERFFMSYLTVKNIPYETQVVYQDLPNRRYDFRIELNGVTFLLETHGAQHFLTEDSGYHRVETIQESDFIKRTYAKSNGIHYIELDCRESTFKYIKQQIKNNNHLENITNEDEVKILKMIENNKQYNTKEIKELYTKENMTTPQISEKYNISISTVNRILKRCGVKLKKDGAAKRRVCQVETGIIFESTLEAGQKTGLKQSNISAVCNNKRKTTGGYHWKFID